MASICGFSTKNEETFRGHDGQGLNCDVYYKGKHIAEYQDLATGGEADIHMVPGNFKLLEQDIMKSIKRFFERYNTRTIIFGTPNIYNGIESIINELGALKEVEKMYKQHMKKNGGREILLVQPYFSIEDMSYDSGRVFISPDQSRADALVQKVKQEMPKAKGVDIFRTLKCFDIK